MAIAPGDRYQSIIRGRPCVAPPIQPCPSPIDGDLRPPTGSGFIPRSATAACPFLLLTYLRPCRRRILICRVSQPRIDYRSTSKAEEISDACAGFNDTSSKDFWAVGLPMCLFRVRSVSFVSGRMVSTVGRALGASDLLSSVNLALFECINCCNWSAACLCDYNATDECGAVASRVPMAFRRTYRVAGVRDLRV